MAPMSPLRHLDVRTRALGVMIGLVLAVGGATPSIAAAADRPPFALEFFRAHTLNEAEADDIVAGGHPFENTTAFQFTHGVQGSPTEGSAEDPKDAYVELPLGFLGNPAATALGTQVGEAGLGVNGHTPDLGPGGAPIFNVAPDFGSPAQFFMSIFNVPITLQAILHPRSDSYAITVGSRDAVKAAVTGARVRFFGIPAQGSTGPQVPFLSNPVDCSEAEPTWKLAVNTWEHPGALRPGGLPDLSNPEWVTATEPAPPVAGCDDPGLTSQFAQISLGVKPLQGAGATQADSPTGLAVELDFPQSNDPTDPTNTTFDPEIPQAPPPKDITVTLPAGLAINPSSAGGLGACSDLATNPAGDQVRYDDTYPVTCPNSAKIGSAVAASPLLPTRDPATTEVNGAEPIPGDVYLLTPHPGDLPIDGGKQQGKFRLLIQLEHERYGINIKLPGVATADPNTGQLTTVFTQNPQLPPSHITVNLKEGPRAPLATPGTCGDFGATSTIVPWSTPGTPDAHPSASFNVGSGANGTPCPANAAARPFAPALSAGTASNRAGASSPFTLHLARADGEGELSALEVTLPKGLAAKFVDVPHCSEAALAAAAARSGTGEQATASCPAASRIGGVTVGAGAGANPFYAHGNAYLSGPYKGAPLSVAVITPAVAGPFDLGTVVVRARLQVDPDTAQAHVVSDPLPTILDGVQLRLRSIDVNLDRPDFTLNPTNCIPMAVDAKLTSTAGASSSSTSYFQAADCAALGFKPSLALSISGGLARNGHPALRAALRSGAGEASLAAATLTLPDGVLLDTRHLRALCARALPAGSCPRASRVGYMRLWSPLFDRPLEGHVYLRVPSHRFPDLVADLRSGGFHVLLHGRTAVAAGGRLRISFPDVPDAPLRKAVVRLLGGPRGIFVNSEALCARPHRAAASLSAHNGKQRQLRPLLRLRGRC